jgi:hypothetical protein
VAEAAAHHALTSDRIAAVLPKAPPPSTLWGSDAVNGSDFLGRQLP